LSVFNGLAENPALPKDILDKLVAMADRQLAWHLTNREDLAPAQLRELTAADPWLMIALADRPNPDPAWARELAVCPDATVREELTARAANLPADVIELLANDLSPDVVTRIATRHPLTPELAEMLARDADEVRWGALARNRTFPVESLRPILDKEKLTMWIRWGLASRQDLPQEIYALLAGEDNIPGIRCDIAGNPAVDTPVLRTLASSGDRMVNQAMVHNPVLPLDLLVEIVAAVRTGPTLLRRIANATEAELRKLAASSTARLRMLVAERPDLPADVVRALVADPDPLVAKSIVKNPMLTADDIWFLLRAHGDRVHPLAARNPNCTMEILEYLAQSGHPAQKVYREIAKHPNASAAALAVCLLREGPPRLSAARHPNLRAAKVVELLADSDPDVVAAAAANPSLPLAVMRSLVR
jgi:hypothetical protein